MKFYEPSKPSKSLLKKLFCLILTIAILVCFSSCAKKDTKIVTCLKANDLVSAIEAAKNIDNKESITKAQDDILEVLKPMINSDLNYAHKNIIDAESFLVDKDVINRFELYKDLLDNMQFELKDSNIISVIDSIISLNEYTKYNELYYSTVQSQENANKFVTELEACSKSYSFPKQMLHNAILSSSLVESSYSNTSDEYVSIAYNYWHENTENLKTMEKKGELTNISNSHEDDYIKLLNNMQKAAKDVELAVDRLPSEVY